MNAQVLVSTFSKESHQLIKLGEAVGAVLQSCTTSKRPFSRVQITTQGKTIALTRLCRQRPEIGDHTTGRQFCNGGFFAPSGGVIVKQAL